MVDAATGEDLTSVTLAQIIVENERNRRAALPTAFLHQLIKHGESWQNFVQQSLQSSMEGVISSQREADRIFREWAARAGLIPAARPATAEAKEPEPTPETESLRDEMKALKEKLRLLEERLGQEEKKR